MVIDPQHHKRLLEIEVNQSKRHDGVVTRSTLFSDATRKYSIGISLNWSLWKYLRRFTAVRRIKPTQFAEHNWKCLREKAVIGSLEKVDQSASFQLSDHQSTMTVLKTIGEGADSIWGRGETCAVHFSKAVEHHKMSSLNKHHLFNHAQGRCVYFWLAN